MQYNNYILRGIYRTFPGATIAATLLVLSKQGLVALVLVKGLTVPRACTVDWCTRVCVTSNATQPLNSAAVLPLL